MRNDRLHSMLAVGSCNAGYITTLFPLWWKRAVKQSHHLALTCPFKRDYPCLFQPFQPSPPCPSYSHHNSCNAATFNYQGSCIASGDADGVIKLWDLRMVAEIMTLDAGKYPANKCAFDPSGLVRRLQAGVRQHDEPLQP